MAKVEANVADSQLEMDSDGGDNFDPQLNNATASITGESDEEYESWEGFGSGTYQVDFSLVPIRVEVNSPI